MACKRREQRKRAKARKKAMEFASNYSLGCCQPTITTTWPKWITMDDVVVKEEKRNDMYNNASATIAVTAVKDDALDYILRRLKDIRYTLYQNLEAAYAEAWPKNKKQAIEWIKEGNFRITQPVADAEEYEWDYSDPFKWGKTDPDLKAKGKAVEALEKAFQFARDVVQVKTDEDVRLKALQDFEAFVA